MGHSGIMPVKMIKVNNIKKILISLLTYQKGTKMDLAGYTNLSNSTLSESINRLCKMNIVKTDGMEESIGGRRPAVYSINPDYGFFIGLSVDENGVSASVTDFTGRLVKSYPVHPLGTKATILLVYEAIERIREEYRSKNLLAVGIGSTGSIDYESGIISESEELNWHNVHLKELIERKFFIPAYLDHKVNSAAFFESLIGHAVDLDSFLFICERYPAKVSMYMNGSILRGDGNLAGNITPQGLSEEQIERLRSFLSVNAVLYARAEETGRDISIPSHRSFETAADYFSATAGLMAEINWYESIYFNM